MIERVELTLSHLGLGCLSEYALITLFANSLFHRLALGKQRPPGEIVDKNGELLYPGYYSTHLTVPPSRLVERHRPWQTAYIGVDVQIFGGMLIESQYILGGPDEIEDDPRTWDMNKFPSMRGSSMFIVDRVEEEPQVSIPVGELIADLPKLTTAPAIIDRFRKLRSQGNASMRFDGNLRSSQPITCQIWPGRDATSNHYRLYRGHRMLFAKFVEMMDHAERALLAEQVLPPFPRPLLDCRMVLERETYYFATPKPDDVVQIGITGQLSPCPTDFHGISNDIISSGILTFVLEVYQQDANTLLAVSKARKLLAVPSSAQSLLRDAERLVFNYCSSFDR